jgi:hypothetical protein
MVDPWMLGQLVFIPPGVSALGILVLVITGIMELRQGHIGRIGIACNAFLLWQIFYAKWVLLPELMQWYLNLGTIFAIIALVSYFLGESLPAGFYSLAFVLYGSISLIVVILATVYLGVPLSLLCKTPSGGVQ